MAVAAATLAASTSAAAVMGTAVRVGFSNMHRNYNFDLDRI
jgi:uncharacterized protein (DUF849 family)